MTSSVHKINSLEITTHDSEKVGLQFSVKIESAYGSSSRVTFARAPHGPVEFIIFDGFTQNSKHIILEEDMVEFLNKLVSPRQPQQDNI